MIRRYFLWIKGPKGGIFKLDVGCQEVRPEWALITMGSVSYIIYLSALVDRVVCIYALVKHIMVATELLERIL